jgi:PilZ domain-containing protein
MNFERHRATCRTFVALIDLTDIQSEKHLAALTKDLSLFGCSVETENPFSTGTNVRLRIWHTGVNFYAGGKVADSQPNTGMGIAFTAVEPGNLPILDTWLAYLKN